MEKPFPLRDITNQPLLQPKPTHPPDVQRLPVTGDKPRSTKRRLYGGQYTDHQQGEVKVTIYYPSGKKSAFVEDESQLKFCKAIVRGSNWRKVVLDDLTVSHPMEVVTSSSKIIAEECKHLCKKTSGSVLLQKSHEDIMNFRWENLHRELESRCPRLLSVLTSAISDYPLSVHSKRYRQVMMAAAIALNERFRDMSVIQYMAGFILTHAGCTQKDIQRLSQIGMTVYPETLHKTLSSWQANLSEDIIQLRDDWASGGQTKYQLVGDNWDKNILPSYRTSDRKTVSLHLFNMYAVVDRVIPQPSVSYAAVLDTSELDVLTFIPSEGEQQQLMTEMTFLLATSLIGNHPELNKLFKNIYPKHLDHSYSQYAGIKTVQYPVGLFDCNENKTQDVIKLLTDLSEVYVPLSDGKIVESVFFGGDRLTDERIQGAQEAMSNGITPKDRLEGFISKIEDFHRLMNFLEAIEKLTYSTKSAKDKGTVYYYRNMLNMRNFKGNVKNAYRPYKMLYYTVLDALCLLLFLHELDLEDTESKICLPENFKFWPDCDKVTWLNEICQCILKKWFFEDSVDIFQELRDILDDPDHPENYWVSNMDHGRVKCHHCDRTYAYVGSLQAHEMKEHNVKVEKSKKNTTSTDADQLHDHLLMLFKLILLHKNLDTAVDMADGERSVRSAKYELPIYNKTNKVKYAIGSIHLTALTSGVLPKEQTERLVGNRSVNLQGGKNRNIALDEYLEMLNRDSKVACSMI